MTRSVIANSGEPVVAVQLEDFEDNWSAMEICSVTFAWTCTLTLWFHLLIVIPYCEPFRHSTAPGEEPLCDTYYGRWDDAHRGETKWRYHWYFFVVFGLTYVAYFIQSVISPTRRYLDNMKGSLVAYLAELKQAQPELWWSIQCYHYETRTETYTDSKGHTRTRTKQVRVNTHSARGAFHYDTSIDSSATLNVSAVAAVTRVRLEKDVSFADDYTKNLYDAEFAAWVAINDRDTHKDVGSGINIPGFVHYVLSCRDERSRPAFFSVGWFWLLTILTFSVVYRHYFYLRTMSVDYVCEKKVSRN